MVKQYRYDYDYAITNALFKNGKLTYRQLKKTIESSEYLNKNLSDDTFNYHIKKMRSEYIIRQKTANWKRGQPIFFHLNRKTEKDINLKILEISYRNEPSKISYNKMIALDKKRQSVDKEYHQKEIRKKIMLMILVYQSIKIPSLYKEKDFTPIQGTISAHDILGGVYSSIPFSYLNFHLSNKRVMDGFQLLEKEKILKMKFIKDNIPYFIIVNPNVEIFINECLNVHTSLIYFYYLMKWYHLRKPNSQERKFFENYYGKISVNDLINKAIEKLKNNTETNSDDYLIPLFIREHESNKYTYFDTKETYKITDELKQKYLFTEAYKEWKENHKELKKKEFVDWKEKIDDLGYISNRYVTELEKKYSRLLKKYPILKTLFQENIFPTFIRNEFQKNINKKIKKNDGYVKKTYLGANLVGVYGTKYIPGSSD